MAERQDQADDNAVTMVGAGSAGTDAVTRERRDRAESDAALAVRLGRVEAEALRARAVALGVSGRSADARGREALRKSSAPAVRRAAASALGKLIDRAPDLRGLLIVSLTAAVAREERPQVLQYLLKTLRKCADALTVLQLDVVRDVVRNPNHPDYARQAANEVLSAAEAAAETRKARLRHWCTRCRRVVTEEEAKRSQARYGKTYCFHCLEEKMHEDATFETDVESAKRLRTVDEVAVQSKGEKRIGDWLAMKGIAYRYDARMLIAGGERIRPDFYLPEFDLYIEYWGMDTPEYLASRQRKQILYQRERKKLISLSFRDLERLEEALEEKLSRHIPRL